MWIPEMGGWVYQDPTFDCYWLVDGKPASALDIHEAVMSSQQIDFAPREKRSRNCTASLATSIHVCTFVTSPTNTSLAAQCSTFADKRLEPLSLSDKNWVHTSDPVDIQRLDTEGNIVARDAQVVPGVFVQLLEMNFFVRDRRQASPGIRVRSSSGTVEGCAYLHQRAEDPRVISGANLAQNPSFRLTSRSNQLAAGWSAVGPVEAMTVSGGQAMSSLPGGRLWQRIQARPHGRYLSVRAGQRVPWFCELVNRRFYARDKVGWDH